MQYTIGFACDRVRSVACWVSVALAATVSTAALGGAPAVPPAATFMRVYGHSGAPNGFNELCNRSSAVCSKSARPTQRSALDAKRWRDLLEVNAIANRTVKPVSDQEQYGVSEYWTLPKRFGDCEDYGLLKQALLVERGWSKGALLITVVRDEAGQGHAVLTVTTKSGDFILDNRQDAIVAWQASPYSFVKRQSTFDPKVWMALEPVDREAPLASASQSLARVSK